MHVCHFCETSVEGAYFKNMAIGFLAKGVEISFLELGRHNPPKWLADVPEAKYYSLGVTRRVEYPLAVWRLARLLKREKIDLLQTHLYYAGLIGVLSKSLWRQTVIVLTRHHTAVVRMLGTRGHIAGDKWMAKMADKVVTVSEAAKTYMIEVDGISRQDIAVVYLGFDFSNFSPNEDERERVRTEFGFSGQTFVIGYAGNFVAGKGHRQLVQAFGAILKRIPSAKLFFVGRGDRTEIENVIAQLGLFDAVKFAGWRDDMPACLNAMDLFVQPSLSEAFSQVLIEAMGVGLPVIATNVGGAREVIDDNINGVLIEPDDVEAIVREVTAAYEHPEFRRTIGDAGRTSVRGRFTAEQMVNRQFGLYRRWMKK